MNVSFKELKESVETDGLVVVDFWAEWCGPCKIMGPVFDSLAENNPEANIVKLEIDKYKEAAMEYGVRNIPTILYFKDGKEVERLSGVQDINVLQEKLDEHA